MTSKPLTLLKLRLVGLGLMLFGSYLFVLAVRSIHSEWTQVFVGLAAVFCAALGFGLLIIPSEKPPDSPPSQ